MVLAENKAKCLSLVNHNAKRIHHYHVQSDTLLLSDASENFRKMYLRNYELDPGHFCSAPALPWIAAWKETKIESGLLKDIDMLVMVEKGIRGGNCHSVNKYTKANKNKLIILYNMYLGKNNLHGKAVLQKLHVNRLESDETTRVTKDFI